MILNGLELNVVEHFWQLAGGKESFPRTLEKPIALALPLAIVRLPALRSQDVDRWLQRRNAVSIITCNSRALRGCLVAQSGHGVLFLDERDPEDEQRFTVAHELAHFLLDYWLPRERLIKKLGPAVIDMIDGFREPNITERVQAILNDVSLGRPYHSLMERHPQEVSAAIWEVENRADRVATALLAPQEAVLPLFNLAQDHYSVRLEEMKNTLHIHFGLPSEVCEVYGRAILRAVGRGPSWIESLGIKKS